AAQHHAALDDDVDFLCAIGDRNLDLPDPGLDGGEAVRKGCRDGSNGNAGAFQRPDRSPDEGVVDADRARLDPEVPDAQPFEDAAAHRVARFGAEALDAAGG